MKRTATFVPVSGRDAFVENAPLPKEHGAGCANGVRKPPERKGKITQVNPAG